MNNDNKSKPPGADYELNGEFLQALLDNAQDPNKELDTRIRCAVALANLFNPLALKSIEVAKAARESHKPEAPQYECRYVRGARVKVKIG